VRLPKHPKLFQEESAYESITSLELANNEFESFKRKDLIRSSRANANSNCVDYGFESSCETTSQICSLREALKNSNTSSSDSSNINSMNTASYNSLKNYENYFYFQVLEKLKKSTLSTPANVPVLCVENFNSNDNRWPELSYRLKLVGSSLKLIEITKFVPINALFYLSELDLIYVRAADEIEGYMPRGCCKPIPSTMGKLSLARLEANLRGDGNESSSSLSNKNNQLPNDDGLVEDANDSPSPPEGDLHASSKHRIDEENKRQEDDMSIKYHSLSVVEPEYDDIVIEENQYSNLIFKPSEIAAAVVAVASTSLTTNNKKNVIDSSGSTKSFVDCVTYQLRPSISRPIEIEQKREVVDVSAVIYQHNQHSERSIANESPTYDVWPNEVLKTDEKNKISSSNPIRRSSESLTRRSSFTQANEESNRAMSNSMGLNGNEYADIERLCALASKKPPAPPPPLSSAPGIDINDKSLQSMQSRSRLPISVRSSLNLNLGNEDGGELEERSNFSFLKESQKSHVKIGNETCVPPPLPLPPHPQPQPQLTSSLSGYFNNNYTYRNSLKSTDESQRRLSVNRLVPAGANFYRKLNEFEKPNMRRSLDSNLITNGIERKLYPVSIEMDDRKSTYARNSKYHLMSHMDTAANMEPAANVLYPDLDISKIEQDSLKDTNPYEIFDERRRVSNITNQNILNKPCNKIWTIIHKHEAQSMQELNVIPGMLVSVVRQYEKWLYVKLIGYENLSIKPIQQYGYIPRNCAVNLREIIDSTSCLNTYAHKQQITAL
jgi:hypothetical protein